MAKYTNNAEVQAHKDRIASLNEQHQAVLDSLTPPQEYEVTKNDSSAPETVNGLVVMPGDYYTTGTDTPRVIPASELVNGYTAA